MTRPCSWRSWNSRSRRSGPRPVGRSPGEVRRPGAPSPRRRDLDYPARDGEQRIRVAALPFIHQNRFLDDFTSPASGTRDYARRLRDIQAELYRGLLDGYQPDRDVLVFAAHLYVESARPSWTERPVEISDTYLTEAGALPAVSYAALGHIHRPQAITRAGLVARYAGSPLQLDFGKPGKKRASSWSTPTPAARSWSSQCPCEPGGGSPTSPARWGRTAGTGPPDRERVRPGRDRQRAADREPGRSG